MKYQRVSRNKSRRIDTMQSHTKGCKIGRLLWLHRTIKPHKIHGYSYLRGNFLSLYVILARRYFDRRKNGEEGRDGELVRDIYVDRRDPTRVSRSFVTSLNWTASWRAVSRSVRRAARLPFPGGRILRGGRKAATPPLSRPVMPTCPLGGPCGVLNAPLNEIFQRPRRESLMSPL